MPWSCPDTTIEDDKDAVRLDIASGVKFSSFSILMPYPGTEIATYCKERGYYDMNPDEMSESLLERSPLSCFTEEEKDQQKNILYLGGFALLIGNFATWFERKARILGRPGKLLNLPIQRLCHLLVEFVLNVMTRIVGPNRFYMAIYYIVKAFTLKYYIYPIEINFVSGITNFMKGFKIEVLRTMPEMSKTATYPAPRVYDSSKRGE